ncbi:MFS transporter [Reyranella sp. CPCC 100927]|uniref:MFS transporter n=1 Tax=Reyranella sp. CPCC 100927 TaxID=2599616 RepID=UPI0015B7635A|nr:MFS transporter [Reyranella sp. CPCC 100927]
MSAIEQPALRQPVTLAVLALGAFAIGTDGYMVIGVLDKIAATYGVSSAQAGQLVTVFSFCYALFAPLCGWLFSAYDRRSAILMASSAFIAGNVLCGFADTYVAMMVGRVVAALGAGMFMPLAFTIATSVSAPARRGTALSIVFGGMTVATALGVPFGTWLGQVIDWRLLFLIIAAMGAVKFVMLAALLPALPPDGPTTLWARLAPVGDRRVLTTVSITFLAVLSEYVFYSYVTVVFADVDFLGSAVLPAILLAFGIGAIIGNIVVGIVTDRLGPRRVLLLALAAQTLLLAAIYLLRQVPLAAIAASFAWGAVSYMYLVPIQHKLLDLSKAAGQMTLALNSSAIYLGIGCGGALGGIALATLGVPSLPVLALVLGIVTLVLIYARF